MAQKCNVCTSGMVIYEKQVAGEKGTFAARCDCQAGQLLSNRIPTLSQVGLNYHMMSIERQRPATAR